MRTVTMYIAEDGKEFHSFYECEEYEKGLALNYLNEFAIPYDEMGERVLWNSVDICVIKVMRVPTDKEWSDHFFEDIWDTYVPTEVSEQVVGNARTGVYVLDPLSEVWHHLDDYRSARDQIEESVQKMYRNKS